jgi:glycerol kinase
VENYILAIDQGTTGTAVHLVDQKGVIRFTADEEFPQIYPKPGWVEHDPSAIWNTVTNGIAQVLKKSGVAGQDVAAIGITNQRETVLVWDRATHKPVMNAIVWQCRRTTEFCEKLKKKKLGPTIQKKTGLVIDPYFSASKIRWILDQDSALVKKAKAGLLAAGTIDCFLLWRLTNGQSHKTDVSNASRTQLMNIEKRQWDSDLLKIFGVPKELLPQISSCNEELGKTHGVPGLPDGIPIHGMIGDQQAALFGQACFEPGTAKCTFGTGSFLLMNTGNKMPKSKSGLLTTIAWQLNSEKNITYALEGGAFICGAAVQWLRDEMKFVSKSSEVESLANQVHSTDGVQMVPAFVGLGAPYWDPEARGLICGMTRGTRPAHIARAVLEAMALQNVDILLAMEKDSGKKMKSLRVDGGAVENNLLMQMQSDFLGVPVQRPKNIESTALGAAFMAGLGVGFWSSKEEIKKVWQLDRDFSPVIKAPERKARLSEWTKAIHRARIE